MAPRKFYNFDIAFYCSAHKDKHDHSIREYVTALLKYLYLCCRSYTGQKFGEWGGKAFLSPLPMMASLQHASLQLTGL